VKDGVVTVLKPVASWLANLPVVIVSAPTSTSTSADCGPDEPAEIAERYFVEMREQLIKRSVEARDRADYSGRREHPSMMFPK